VKWFLLLVPFLFSGCAFWNDANRVGGDIDLGIDGILANVAGIHFKASVAIEREVGDAKGTPADGTGGDRGFL
jgi:hypothetical protein